MYILKPVFLADPKFRHWVYTCKYDPDQGNGSQQDPDDDENDYRNRRAEWYKTHWIRQAVQFKMTQCAVPSFTGTAISFLPSWPQACFIVVSTDIPALFLAPLLWENFRFIEINGTMKIAKSGIPKVAKSLASMQWLMAPLHDWWHLRAWRHIMI